MWSVRSMMWIVKSTIRSVRSTMWIVKSTMSSVRLTMFWLRSTMWIVESTMRTVRLTMRSQLQHQPHRLLQVAPQRAQVVRAEGAVDDAVVAGHGYLHPVADRHLTIDHHRLRAGGADGEDGHIRRVDDGRELL